MNYVRYLAIKNDENLNLKIHLYDLEFLMLNTKKPQNVISNISCNMYHYISCA